MRLNLVLRGIATYVPGLAARRAKGTGGTNSARYCYSVWLRHLVMAHRNGLSRTCPRAVLELGPGDSLGIGLAALLTGAEQYYGLDVVHHSSVEQNLAVLDELVALFRKRAEIPCEDEFPRVRPMLDSYGFPSHILPPEDLAKLLDDARIEIIRQSIHSMNEPHSNVRYVTGSRGAEMIPPHSVDMVLSQAVLEYVQTLRETYQLMHSWLRPDGFVSHQIDFSCHGLAPEWDGHWAYSDFMWKLIRGKRVWFINREPYSAHIALLQQTGFRVVGELKVKAKAAKTQTCVAPRFANLSPEDKTTRGAFIQAVKTKDPFKPREDEK